MTIRRKTSAVWGDGETLLSKPDLKRIVGMSIRTLDRMVQAELIPAPVRIGVGVRRRARWRRSDIDLWLAVGCPNRRDFERAKVAQIGGAQ